MKIPKTENGKTVTVNMNNHTYLITHNTDKMKFTLWEIINKDYDKIATANSPFELYEKIYQISVDK